MTNRQDGQQDEHRRVAQQATEGRTATLTPDGPSSDSAGNIAGIQGRDGVPPDVALLKRMAVSGAGRGNREMFQQLTQQVARKYGNAYVMQILSEARRASGVPQLDGAGPGLSPNEPPVHLSDIDTRNVPRPSLNLPARQTLGLPKPAADGATTATPGTTNGKYVAPAAETTTTTPPKGTTTAKPGTHAPTNGHGPTPAAHPAGHKAAAPKGTAPHKPTTPKTQHPNSNGAGHTTAGGTRTAGGLVGASPHAAPLTPAAEGHAGAKLVIEQVMAAANAGRSKVSGQVAQGVAAINAAIQQQHSALTAAGATESAAIKTAFGGARTSLTQIFQQAQSQLTTAATGSQTTLTQGFNTAQTQAQTAFTTHQQKAGQLGTTYGGRTTAAANTSANSAQTQVEGIAGQARQMGNNAGSGDPDGAEARAKAAHDLAEDTANNIMQGLGDFTSGLRATAPDMAAQFQQQGRDAATQIGTGLAGVTKELTDSRQSTTTALQQAVQQGTQALTQGQTQLMARLNTMEQQSQTQLQTQVTQQGTAIDNAGKQAISGFQSQGQKAIAAGDAKLAQFKAQAAGVQVDPKRAGEAAAPIIAQVNSAYSELTGTISGAEQQVVQALQQAGTDAVGPLHTLGQQAGTQAKDAALDQCEKLSPLRGTQREPAGDYGSSCKYHSGSPGQPVERHRAGSGLPVPAGHQHGSLCAAQNRAGKRSVPDYRGANRRLAPPGAGDTTRARKPGSLREDSA